VQPAVVLLLGGGRDLPKLLGAHAVLLSNFPVLQLPSQFSGSLCAMSALSHRNGPVNQEMIALQQEATMSRIVQGDGCVYEGEVSGGMANGFGVLTSPTGMRYEGQWHNNLKHGQGNKLFAGTGHTWEGEWFHDKRHGPGVLKDAHGKLMQQGVWHNDAIVRVDDPEQSQQQQMRMLMPVPGSGAGMVSQPQLVLMSRERRPTNHACHYILCTHTGGLWLPFWVAACFDCGCKHPCDC
jgi:hypothetical protein